MHWAITTTSFWGRFNGNISSSRATVLFIVFLYVLFICGSLNPYKNFEIANNLHMSFGIQLVHDILIKLHSNNHHLINCCCHGNKTKNPRWPPIASSSCATVLFIVF